MMEGTGQGSGQQKRTQGVDASGKFGRGVMLKFAWMPLFPFKKVVLSSAQLSRGNIRALI